MEVKAIRTDAEYRYARCKVPALVDLDPERKSPEGERLEMIGTRGQACEAEHCPIAPLPHWPAAWRASARVTVHAAPVKLADIVGRCAEITAHLYRRPVMGVPKTHSTAHLVDRELLHGLLWLQALMCLVTTRPCAR
ncbi:hypothetical protein J7E62_32145 [Variovorax paradoxus]|nr:hypothetical protein [Variovorax paradoxus]